MTRTGSAPRCSITQARRTHKRWGSQCARTHPSAHRYTLDHTPPRVCTPTCDRTVHVPAHTPMRAHASHTHRHACAHLGYACTHIWIHPPTHTCNTRTRTSMCTHTCNTHTHICGHTHPCTPTAPAHTRMHTPTHRLVLSSSSESMKLLDSSSLLSTAEALSGGSPRSRRRSPLGCPLVRATVGTASRGAGHGVPYVASSTN